MDMRNHGTFLPVVENISEMLSQQLSTFENAQLLAYAIV